MPDFVYAVGSAHRILLHLYIAVAFIDPHCEYQDAGKRSKLLMTKCSKSPAAKSIIPMVTNENITKYIFCLIIDYPYCPCKAPIITPQFRQRLS